MEEYSPNKIPKPTRIFNIIWAAFLLGLCCYAFIKGSFVYPGVRGSEPVELSGASLILFGIGLISGALNAVLVVVDHYDKRDNEFLYKQIAKVLNVIGVVAIVLAFGYQFIVNQESVVVLNNVR
ncbi:hypothetical protein AltI4_20940 [Alteromonas sp. I4]|nr:hypothetical protein AltI4_20940 [Alteromonas sp. I4]